MRPLLGHGAGVLAEQFTGRTWSAHNLYMQVMLQTNFLGMFGLVLLFGSVWREFWPGKKAHIVRLAAALFVGGVIREVFEVTLIQNNVQTGVLLWLVVAVGINASVHAGRVPS